MRRFIGAPILFIPPRFYYWVYMSCFDATHKKKKKTKKLHDEKTPRNNDLLRSQYFDGSMDFIEQQKHAIFLSLSLYGRE